jgi:hypothetical protein
MLIQNYTQDAIQLDANGVAVVLLPGNRTIPEGVLPEDLVSDLALDRVDGLRILSEYPSVTLKEL